MRGVQDLHKRRGSNGAHGEGTKGTEIQVFGAFQKEAKFLSAVR
jgi:hypothetical protein